MATVNVLNRYAVSSGHEFMKSGLVSRRDVEKEYNVSLPSDDEDVFEYIFMERELVGSDRDFIEDMLDRRGEHWLVEYNNYSDEFLLIQIDGRSLR